MIFLRYLEYASALEVPEPFSAYQLFNFNWMLPGHTLGRAKPHAYPGLDGLKTGHTQLAGYCFTGTAERDGMRLISVVMRSDSENTRFQETRKILDYGFNNFILKELVTEGAKVEGLETLPVYRGKEKEVPVAVGQSLTTVIHKDEEDLYSLEYVPDPELVNETGMLTAPVAKGDVVGSVRLAYTGDLHYDLLVAGESPSASSSGCSSSRTSCSAGRPRRSGARSSRSPPSCARTSPPSASRPGARARLRRRARDRADERRRRREPRGALVRRRPHRPRGLQHVAALARGR